MNLETARRGRSADYELQIHAVEILYLEMGKLIRGSSCVSIPDRDSYRLDRLPLKYSTTFTYFRCV